MKPSHNKAPYENPTLIVRKPTLRKQAVLVYFMRGAPVVFHLHLPFQRVCHWYVYPSLQMFDAQHDSAGLLTF